MSTCMGNCPDFFLLLFNDFYVSGFFFFVASCLALDLV